MAKTPVPAPASAPNPAPAPAPSPAPPPSKVPGDLAAFFAPEFIGPAAKAFKTQKFTVVPNPMGPFLRIAYPRGSTAPSSGGPDGGAQVFLHSAAGPAEEATLEYRLRLPSGFQWVKGGKLPGLAGGTANTGGVDPNGTDGWSARLMWRPGGAGEVYAYLATTKGYGEEFGKGNWVFQADDRWHTLTQHVHLNTPGKPDGFMALSYDGRVVLTQTGLLFRTVPSLKIDGLLFSTFYGGHDSTGAPTADMSADFADFRLL